MHRFEGQSADLAWQQIVEGFRTRDGVVTQAGRGGLTHEILNAVVTVFDPRQRWVMSRRPAINPAFCVAEVVWIVRGRRDAAFLSAWNSQYTRFTGDSQALNGAYGYRLRVHHGVDQLRAAYEALKSNPESRQVVLQIWDPEFDLPDSTGKPKSEDIPCNVCAILKVRDNRLHWLQIMRSNDLFLGLPHNIVQWTSLQEVLAGWLGLQLGPYVHVANSLHVYENHLDDVLKSASPEELRNPDSLALPWDESDHWFRVLEDRIECLGQGTVTREAITQLVQVKEMPTAYQNLLVVVGAEAARRQRFYDLRDTLMGRCTNEALCQVWGNWSERTAPRR